MKITKQQLKQIIKEELANVLDEQLPEPSKKQKCERRGGEWRVKPGTDQMECIMPSKSLDEDLEVPSLPMTPNES